MADALVIGGQLGSYLIESVIGRGGMSVVYRAKHARLGTAAALKVLAPELSSDDNFRERFLREAQMAAGIDHPNVVPIHDMGLRGNSLYIVMRYVSGGDLKSLLASSAPLDPETALELLTPVALALDAAHAAGLVHRDVKPGNILVQRSRDGEVEQIYLTDFGIAKSSHLTGLTRAGGVIGTIEYMAPEQLEGREVSPQTDVYALACVLYECITGRTPFERELTDEMLQPSRAPVPASTVRRGLPKELDAVLARALSQHPAERHSTCAALIAACEKALRTPSPVVAAVGETVAARTGRQTADERSQHAPVRVAGDASDAAEPPIAQEAGGRQMRRYGIAALAVAAAAAAAAAIVLATSSSGTASGALSSATLGEVPTNHVTGYGEARVRLRGNVATFTVTTHGLDYGEALVHPVHVHAGGKGVCPPASAARPHNGHLTISTTDGIKYYGPPAVALTTRGDTSPASILTFPRFLVGGALTYSRTIVVPASVASAIRGNNAVVVVHGTDYDHSGIYSNALDRSDLNKSVPATLTAPALCGTLVAARNTATASARSSGATSVYVARLTEDPALAGSEALWCEPVDTAALSDRARRGGGSRTA